MKTKKRPMTIIEMMVVITLIGLIAAVVGYNMQGTLEKGKAKQTELAIQKITDILELEYSQQNEVSLKDIAKEPAKYLKKSGLVKNPTKLLKDGWGQSFRVDVEKDRLVVVSKKYNAYKAANATTNATSTSETLPNN